jgi:hypothetical protein
VRIVPAVLLAMLLLLSGCQTTAEKSAALAKKFHRETISQHGLSITRVSHEVKVLDTTLVHDANGTAAVVRLRNEGSRALREVPIAIDVKDAHGSTLFQNNAPGLETALVSIPSLAGSGEMTWIEDQVPTSGQPAKMNAQVGEAPTAAGSLPKIEVKGVHLDEEASNGIGAAGTVENRSKVAQHSLVVFVLARRAGKVMAAGRAVLAEVAAGAAMPWQVFFVGDPRGAKLEVSAPASTLG